MRHELIEPDTVFSPREIRRLQRWIKIYESPLGALLEKLAEKTLQHFDDEYFRRTGLLKSTYVEHLIQEAKHVASLRFTEMPNGANVTAFHFPEEEQQRAYKQFESSFLAQCAAEEKKLRFKGYVARRFGLRIRLRRDEKSI